MGDSLLVPVTEVGSMAAAFGWLAACVSFAMVDSGAKGLVVAGTGALVSLILLLMKLLPMFPGHFSVAEWIAFGIWLTIGLAFHLVARAGKPVGARPYRR